MRFYDVNSGQILLDNHDVRDYNRRDLRKAFGMVLQDTWLYKGTIMEISVMDVWMQQMKKLSRQQSSSCRQLYPNTSGRLQHGT